jgi:CRP-like cAMP-binding protein
MKDAEARSILATRGWLSGEPEWLRDAMVDCGTLQTYRAGEFTHFAGDATGGMFGIASGGFGVMIPVATGDLVLCHVLGKGTWFGLGPILTDRPRTLTYRAMETSHVLYVSQPDLAAIAQTQPEFYRRVAMLSEGSYYGMAVRVLGDLLVNSSERRVAAVLSRLAGAGPAVGGEERSTIRLSQADIGQISNASRDRVNRALQKFVKAGWIALDYKAVVIRDLKALEAFVQRERH